MPTTDFMTRRAISPDPADPPPIPPDRIDPALAVIGVYKFVKVALLVSFALGVGHLLKSHQSAVDFTHDLIDQFKLDPESRFMRWALTRLARVNEHTLHALRLASWIYAGLFATEGTGLLLRFRWAEWMVIVTTAGLLPVEGYEVYHRPDWLRISAVVVNVAVVVFLLYRVRHPRGEKTLHLAERPS